MESFVHLRKGRTPKRLHADLDGLKDDELGRGGFTGRTANIYRRHDPTAYRASGPLRPVDVLSDQLKPSDAADAAGGPLLMFSNADCQVLLSRRSEPMPFFVRYVDGDLLSFVHRGSGLLETEFGPKQRAFVTGPDGQAYAAEYTLQRQPDGTWKISGCTILKDDSPSI